MSSITRRVDFSADVEISHVLFAHLKRKFNLKFTLQANEEFLDEFSIIRANFKTESDYSKIHQDSFKISVRERRKVPYKSFRNGKQIIRYFNPTPKFCLAFKRNDQVLNKN